MRAPIRIRMFDAGHRFGRHRGELRIATSAAVRHVKARSTLSNVDIVIHPLDLGEHEIGVSGQTLGPHNVHIGIEVSQLGDPDLAGDLFRTVVHELHHALRWRHIRSRWTVAEALALEGLAVLADEDAAGPQDDLDRPLNDFPGALRHLATIAAEPLHMHRTWVYASEPDQPGGVARVYRLGAIVMRAALEGNRLDAWSAATRPAATLVATGLARLGQVMTAPAGRQSR